MSLRLRLVLAFGYVLLFAIIALEVPLTLNFSRRVDSEIKAEASAGAQAVPRPPRGGSPTAAALAALAREQARRLGGRVIVVDARGRVLVDSDGAAPRGTPTPAGPRSPRRSAAPPRRAPATATRSTPTCSTRPCRSSTRAVRPARCA